MRTYIRVKPETCDFCGEKEVKIESNKGTFYKCVNCSTIHGELHDNNNAYRKAWEGEIKKHRQSPCKGCEDRHMHCHEYCSDYIEFSKLREEMRQYRYSQYDIDSYIECEVTKNCRR